MNIRSSEALIKILKVSVVLDGETNARNDLVDSLDILRFNELYRESS